MPASASTETIFSVSRYALSTLCRRRLLLRSLGQEAAQVCHRCDNCIRSTVSERRPASEVTEEARSLMRILQDARKVGQPLTPITLESKYFTASTGIGPALKRKEIRALIAFMQAVEPKLLDTSLRKHSRSAKPYAYLTVCKPTSCCEYCY